MPSALSWCVLGRKCLFVLSTGLDRGKSKNKLAFGRAITLPAEGGAYVCLLFQTYFWSPTPSKVTRGQGRPPPVWQPRKAGVAGKGTCSSCKCRVPPTPPPRDEREVKVSPPLGIVKGDTVGGAHPRSSELPKTGRPG